MSIDYCAHDIGRPNHFTSYTTFHFSCAALYAIDTNYIPLFSLVNTNIYLGYFQIWWPVFPPITQNVEPHKPPSWFWSQYWPRAEAKWFGVICTVVLLRWRNFFSSCHFSTHLTPGHLRASPFLAAILDGHVDFLGWQGGITRIPTQAWSTYLKSIENNHAPQVQSFEIVFPTNKVSYRVACSRSITISWEVDVPVTQCSS